MVGKNKDSNFLFYFSVVLLVVAVGVFFLNVSRYTNVTGNVVGTANLTIESRTSINFSTANLTWGRGSVTPGQTVATLSSSGGVVTNGNWTVNSAGLILENIGNQNVSLEVLFGKSASAFIGGSAGTVLTDGDYRYNVSDNEIGSCLNNTKGIAGTVMSSGYNKSVFFYVNNTSPGTKVCDLFQFGNNNDTIRIDIYLNISSTSSVTGSVEDTITATATAL